jgi:hypothetical protein
MGEGNSRLDRMEEILDRAEASRVRLRTDHELFVKEHEKFVADKRIADLVSGVGEFMRRDRAQDA